jgi:hypothetical protein
MTQQTDNAGSAAEPIASPPGQGGMTSLPPVVAPERARRGRKPRPRQTRVVIKKVGPWSVFKFSLLFYLCIMLVILLAFCILYAMLGAIGALDSVTKLTRDLFADPSFQINGKWIFTRLAVIGLAMVIIWSFINLLLAFLYNLISDVVGGIEVTLAERR